MVGEIGLADHEQARDRRHQIVVDPEPAHGVVRRGVDAHRNPVRVLSGDSLVHLEQVAVLRRHRILAETLDGVGKVEIDPPVAVPHSESLIANRLRGSRCDVPGDQVAKRRVAPLEVVVAFGLGNLVGRAAVALLLGHPDPAIVAQ